MRVWCKDRGRGGEGLCHMRRGVGRGGGSPHIYAGPCFISVRSLPSPRSRSPALQGSKEVVVLDHGRVIQEGVVVDQDAGAATHLHTTAPAATAGAPATTACAASTLLYAEPAVFSRPRAATAGAPAATARDPAPVLFYADPAVFSCPRAAPSRLDVRLVGAHLLPGSVRIRIRSHGLQLERLQGATVSVSAGSGKDAGGSGASSLQVGGQGVSSMQVGGQEASSMQAGGEGVSSMQVGGEGVSSMRAGGRGRGERKGV